MKGEGHRFWRMSRVIASSNGVILMYEGPIAKQIMEGMERRTLGENGDEDGDNEQEWR